MPPKKELLADFAKAVTQFETALSTPATTDLIKAGCIQYFEFCFELAWKCVKTIARDQGLPECFSPKACLKTAFKANWLTDEPLWLAMLEDRNRMSHTYDAADALVIYTRLTGYAAALRELESSLRPLAME